VKYFDWNKDKNKLLKMQRGISFEDVQNGYENGSVIDVIEHPNKFKYPNQKMFVLVKENYVYLVPFVEDKEKVFLKTIIPSHKMTKKYLYN
jgi:uncharacterized DUF497 family protein